jgi:hypothetical protein
MMCTGRNSRTARVIATLEDLPNVGKAIADDFRALGIHKPAQLKRKEPYTLYDRLNRVTGVRHDPCLLDTFIAVTRFVDGGPARPWWTYTAERKRKFSERAARKRGST